jgi:nucleotide-binding universal stress UspA family protein
MKTILIPTDFSENSWNAVEYAVRLFHDIPCTFYMLHVGRLSQSNIRSNSLTMPPEDLEISVKEKLTDLFERIERLPIEKSHHFIALQEYGNLVGAIRKVVDDHNINLIVMGTKGASGIQRAIIGSNTGDVITKVARNLLVIPEKAVFNKPKEIAFPTDFTIFYSHAILSALSEILRITGANLQVINVTRPKMRFSRAQNQNKGYLTDYLEELFKNSHSFHTLTDKTVKTAIESFTEKGNIDMLVMVAKNLNFLQQLLFDSTIEKLSFHTTLPLLVLHE